MTFEFVMKAAQRDLSGYAYTRWDQATPITVRAETKQEAINKAGKVMGDARSGYDWVFSIEDIREIPEPNVTEEGAA